MHGRGVSSKGGPGQLPSPSFPTTNGWRDKHRSIPALSRVQAVLSVKLRRNSRHAHRPCILHQARQRELVAESLVQQRIELGPDLVFLGTAKVAGVAAICDFGGRSFWLMMIEIEVAPAARSGKALGILDGHIRAVESAGEIAPPRRLGSRAVAVLSWQRELQLLEQDCPFGELIGLLEYLVGARLDVDVVILREPGLAAIERVGSERRSDVHPFVEILRQNQIARRGVLGQIARLGLRLRAGAGEPLREYGGCNDHGTPN